YAPGAAAGAGGIPAGPAAAGGIPWSPASAAAMSALGGAAVCSIMPSIIPSWSCLAYSTCFFSSPLSWWCLVVCDPSWWWVMTVCENSWCFMTVVPYAPCARVNTTACRCERVRASCVFLLWPRRTQRGFSCRILRDGCVPILVVLLRRMAYLVTVVLRDLVKNADDWGDTKGL